MGWAPDHYGTVSVSFMDQLAHQQARAIQSIMMNREGNQVAFQSCNAQEEGEARSPQLRSSNIVKYIEISSHRPP